MKKIILALSFLATIVSQTEAQQDPLYAQYLNNPLVINPAYTGINNVLNASLSYRSQWSGLDGAPRTVSLSAHSSFFENKIGGGLIIVSDKLGNLSNTQISASGSYKIELTNATFSFGLQAGIQTYKEDNTELLVKDPNDDVFDENYTSTKFNIGAGMALKGERFFLGLSIPRMINSSETFDNTEVDLYNRHVYLTGGYVFYVGTSLALRPSALLKVVADAPASVDLNMSALFLDKYTAGVITRNFKTYGLLAQMNISDNLRLGYVFEVPTNKSVGSRFNSHEITLTLDLEVFDFHFQDERYF